MYENVDDLKKDFPLEDKYINGFVDIFSIMKEVLSEIISRQTTEKIDEGTYSEIIQLYYFKSIGLEAMFINNPKFRFGLEILSKHYGSQIEIFKKYLYEIAMQSQKRGVSSEFIESYLTHYFEAAFLRLFPNQPSIMNELFRDSKR